MDIHGNSCSKPSAKRNNFIFMFILVLFDKLQFINERLQHTSCAGAFLLFSEMFIRLS